MNEFLAFEPLADLGAQSAWIASFPITRSFEALASFDMPPYSLNACMEFLCCRLAAPDHLQARLDKLFGAGHGYADLVPSMQRVVQAAGRVLRTPQDRGWLWLLDDRYLQPEVIELLPAWWLLAGPQGGDGDSAR